CGIRADLGMAVHAGLGGRNTGKAGIFNRGVAIAAIKPQSCGVMLMAERYGLLRRFMLPGDIGRALQLHERCAYSSKQKYYAKNAGTGQGICTAVKDLSHYLKLFSCANRPRRPASRIP